MRTGRGTSQQKKGTERAGRQCDGSPLSTHRDSRGPNATTTAIGGSSTHTEEPPATASPSSSPPPPPPAPSPAPSRSANSSDAARNLTEVQSSFIFCFFFVFAYRAALGVHSTLFPTDGRSEEPPGVRRRGDVAVGRRTSHRRGDVKRRPHPKLHRPPDVAMATPVRGTCCSRAA